MIKQGIKNYFVSLKYFFTPLGTMFLGMMIGLSFLIPGIFNAISSLVDGIGALGKNLNLDFKDVWNTLWANITSLDWNNPNSALNTVFSTEWIHQILTDALETLLGTDFDTFKTQIENLVNDFANHIGIAIIVFFIWWIIGFIAGYILIRFLIRRNIARRGLWKYILSIICNAILSTVLVVTSVILFAIWHQSIFISFILILLLIGFFNLLEAFLIHGRKKVSFKRVVNLKNIGSYLLTNFLIFIISLFISLLAFLINAFMGLFVALSLFEIAFLVISMNAESFVKSLVIEDEEV